jgi:hypothetical protein
VSAVRERAPDFQRPAGDYDSWYIRDSETHAYLRGFEHWERVDGALVRWIIQGPLCWLGLAEVSTPDAPDPEGARRKARRLTLRPTPGMAETAFRITAPGAAFLGKGEWMEAGQRIEANTPADTHVHIGLDGVLSVPAAIAPYHRFRVARVTKWLGLSGETYTYRLTPGSLRRAARQGVVLGRIVDFLREIADENGLPPSLLNALQRWARSGAEVTIQEVTVLRFKSPELLETLQRTPKVKDYLGRQLGPTVVEVRRESADKVRAILAEMGILSD